MSFAFKTRHAVGQQVRSIAGEQIDKALDGAKSGDDFDKTVHALRRRCKKIRGLLRLVEPNFEDFKAENSAVRDAADLLGGARDARVMVETLDSLTVAGHTQRARSYLVDRADRSASAFEDKDPLGRFANIFTELGGRAKHWSFDTHGFGLVGEGLEKTYKAFLTDFDLAERNRDAVAMHEWRKRSKHHWYHVTLLVRSAPDLLEPRAKALDHLGEYLGDHHNLAVLQEALTRTSDEIGDSGPILAAIEKQQQELAGKAFALGRQLAAEKPRALHNRFEAYWAFLPKEA